MLDALARGDVALVSDAGTPAINDPGFELVVAAIDAGFPVIPVPGPAAPIAALIGSGLPTAQWAYLGFLPSRPADRRRVLEAWSATPATLICFEAPHRLRASLKDIQTVLGDRRVAVARELTKLHEEWIRGVVGDAIRHFDAVAPRGELTLVLAGYQEQQDRPARDEAAEDWRALARERLLALRAEGLSGSTAAKQVARALNVPRGEVYNLWSELPGDD